MRFTIRDLLLVTVIVALAAGWWVDRRRLSQVIERQKVELEAMRVQEEAARARLTILHKVHSPFDSQC